MLARLKLYLDARLDFRRTSLLQGVLMENISSEYADFLHTKKLHPYSEYVLPQENGAVWAVQTLNEEAYENIIKKLAQKDEFFLAVVGKEIHVLRREEEILPKSSLMEDFYTLPTKNIFNIEFLTPAAFRQRGRYYILPDIRLLCQNLMMKYSAASDLIDMGDEDTLRQITEDTFIMRHNLRSAVFPAEGQNIPGFVGSLRLKCNGTDTMARYLRLLLTFGEFSGVGVKTAMGMGAMRGI